MRKCKPIFASAINVGLLLPMISTLYWNNSEKGALIYLASIRKHHFVSPNKSPYNLFSTKSVATYERKQDAFR